MDNPIIYVVLNGELNMSPGKAAAQAVHAAAMIDGVEEFGQRVIRTVIVLEAKNTQQILNLHRYLQNLLIESKFYIDEGVNEVDSYSVTALAAGPIWSNNDAERQIFSSFPLFPAKKKRWFSK